MSRDVSRCSFAVDVGDFGEPCKILCPSLMWYGCPIVRFALPHEHVQHKINQFKSKQDYPIDMACIDDRTRFDAKEEKKSVVGKF